ncbi:MAG: hypothetical protein WBY44_32090 [Bryobacteraceae bacterium]
MNRCAGLTTYRGRRAASIENETIRVTVLREGGHIAEILHKPTGINPLWTPPWDSIEPSTYSAAKHPEYGSSIEARLLAGIMGHNLCLDIFGGPSDEEAAAGVGAHGEGSVAAYDVRKTDGGLVMTACFPLAQIRLERVINLREYALEIREVVESLAAFDRPIGWTQHVTLGPPFLESGITRFQMSATKSKAFESPFGAADYLEPGATFEWPLGPRNGEGVVDLSIFNSAAVSSAFTAHLMDPLRENAFFSAYHPGLNLSFGYSWKRADFPWLGRWEENRGRTHAPWNGSAVACGLEFGVSPFPETRRQMIDRGALFGEPTYRWLPAHARLEAAYTAGFGV